MKRNNVSTLAIAIIAIMNFSAVSISAASFGTAEIVKREVLVNDLKDAAPYEGKMGIKSKCVQPVYLMLYSGTFRNLITVRVTRAGQAAVDASIVELRENEELIITPVKRDSKLMVLMAPDRAPLDSLMNMGPAGQSNDKRNDYIYDVLIKGTNSPGVNFFSMSSSEFDLVFVNNMGLIPGLLRGEGEAEGKTNNKFEKQLGALRVVYKQNNIFQLELKPKEYAEAAKNNAIKASDCKTIEGVVIDVVSFEKAKGY